MKVRTFHGKIREMKLLFTILLVLPVLGFATEAEMITQKVKDRKKDVELFREKVSMGNRCPVRDYKCFQNEIVIFLKGHVVDITAAEEILNPFLKRSMNEGFPPCEKACQQTLLAQHIYVFLDFLTGYKSQDSETQGLSAYPTVELSRIRAIMDLTAYNYIKRQTAHLEKLYGTVKFDAVTNPEFRDRKIFEEKLTSLKKMEGFQLSVLCRLSPGDFVYDEIASGSQSKSPGPKNLATWLEEFQSEKDICKISTPFDYRGVDTPTRNLYRNLREKKLAEIKCKNGDFGCVRKHLRALGINYAEDIGRVNEFLSQFVKASKPRTCDAECESQLLVRKIQTWITYLSTFERDKLASTMDPKNYPDAKYLALSEDVKVFELLKLIMEPIVIKFGTIDSAMVKDAGLRSELKSVGKDLSDFSVGKFLKDSVICTMDPWKASYETYLTPYKDKELDKKFEASFLEFKEKICKL